MVKKEPHGLSQLSLFILKQFIQSHLSLSLADIQKPFFANLPQPLWPGEIFDEIADTVYFIKDIEGRYMAVNQTLARRCGATEKEELIGKTAIDVFPAPLGADYTRQDLALIAGGPNLTSRLELHLYPSGESGWCLTWKKALRNANGEVIGLTGLSRDLASTMDGPIELKELAKVLNHIRENLDKPLTLADLQQATGLSTFQIDQRIKRLFGLSTRQYIMRSRIEEARHLLTSSDHPLTEIALSCGFSDQSSFTRQFKKAAGITPKNYRNQ